MNTYILDYLQNQLKNETQFIRRFTQDSRGQSLPARDLKTVIDGYINDFLKEPRLNTRWVIIPGLRGVGKTTLMAQVYSDLLMHFKDKINLLYISLETVVDVLNSNLYEALDNYEQILGGSLASVNKPTFLFIDEVQADKKWAATLKFIYDQSSQVFIFCTGSSATHLQMSADIAGRRAIIEKLYPLSFAEFQLLSKNKKRLDKNLRQDLLNALYSHQDATNAYKQLQVLQTKVNQQWVEYDRKSLLTYLQTSNLPFTLNEEEYNIYGALRKMVNKIIETDLRVLKNFDNSSLTSIKRLLFILAEVNDVISLPKLESVTNVNSSRIFSFLDALVQAELLIKVPAYGNYMASSRKPARYQFASPALRSLHYDPVGQKLIAARRGAFLEDLAALHYQQEFVDKNQGFLAHYYNKKQSGHCDFVLDLAIHKTKIAIEVGLGHKDTAQVKKTIKQINANYGIVFANSSLKIDEGKQIIIVPLDIFYLL